LWNSSTKDYDGTEVPCNYNYMVDQRLLAKKPAAAATEKRKRGEASQEEDGNVSNKRVEMTQTDEMETEETLTQTQNESEDITMYV
jgi:hypothetical protein